MTRFASRTRVLLPGLLALLFALIPLCTPAAFAQDGGVYIVQPGDTLSEIAAASGTDVATLRELNGITGNMIRIGQQLILSGRGRPAAPASSAGGSPTASADGPIYVVKQGDNLTKIAQRFSVSVESIMAANHIANARLIAVGQALVIPGGVGVEGAGAQEAAAAEAARTAKGPSYTVQPGDNLSSIAQHYGASVDAILLANNLDNARLIRVGQTLIIPNGIEEYETAPDPITAGELPQGLREGEKWIDVDLSEQRVIAYEGAKPVGKFRVSTGLPGTPTVTGSFRIRLKVPVQDMSGGNRAAGDFYDLKDVQWVQYFFEDYAFHGTYWHTNFGHPASRGCINMTNADAEWLYSWTEPGATIGDMRWKGINNGLGTVVIVHY